jgi:hypothetical protein
MRTLRVAWLFHDRACGNAFAGPGGWVLYCRYAPWPAGVPPEEAQLPARLYLGRILTPRR